MNTGCLKNRLLLGFVFFSCLTVSGPASARNTKKLTNKLLYMYRIYYLPFSIDFREGANKNEIIPLVVPNGARAPRLVKANELQSINRVWDGIKQEWRKRSLFLKTSVGLNKKAIISQRLISHSIPVSRRAFDTIPLNNRIQYMQAIKDKPLELQQSFKQLRFLKTFLPSPVFQTKFNVFVISASWCESCREYRVLFESYFKKFPNPNVVLHSVVIEDPKEEIFDSEAMKELFPTPKKYSHESIPRFLAMEVKNRQPIVYSEGDALKQIYERFLKKNRGFLNSKTALFKRGGARRNISSRR